MFTVHFRSGSFGKVEFRQGQINGSNVNELHSKLNEFLMKDNMTCQYKFFVESSQYKFPLVNNDVN